MSSHYIIIRMKVKFIKCHGSGNDFILLDGLTSPIGFTENEYAGFTRIVCDRKGPVGADGVLFLLPSGKADARMRIFNSDGSEAEMCGNGLRCTARLASELLNKKKVTIETAGSVVSSWKESDMFPKMTSYKSFLGAISFDSPDFGFKNDGEFVDMEIPGLSEEYKFTAVSIGNPHIVSVVEGRPSDRTVKEIGEKANSDKALFPNGVNVTFFCYFGEQSIYTVTYERGVGLTQACGTAMVASGVASCRMEFCREHECINVYNKGGMIRCRVDTKDGATNVHMMGNATFEYSASMEYDGRTVSEVEITEEYPEEVKAYENFRNRCSDFVSRHLP